MVSLNWVRDDIDDLNLIRKLFTDYQRELGIDLCFQGFESELPNLPYPYAEPTGALLLLKFGETAAGCGALKQLKSDSVELKRLYIAPEFRQMGLAREICGLLIRKAKEIGYQWMYLDTLDTLTKAIQLYESIGFEPTDPYNDSGGHRVRYFRLNLRD